MSQLALHLIEKEKAEKTGYLNIGRCGLKHFYESELQSVWNALSELTHLDTLILSNEWYDKKKEGWSHSQNEGEENVLDKIPQVMESLVNLKKLVIAGGYGNENWEISKLENLPQSITTLDISQNEISKLENLPQNIATFYIHKNQISKLENLPQSIATLDISQNEISKLENLPQNLILLDISSNQISKLENLPQSITRLDISSNQISKLENLPQSITRLHINSNQINKVENLPQSITTLHTSSNQINKLENLPQSITTLHISSNQISKLENLPQSITLLHISSNQISKLENLPQSIITLDISRNQISKLENLPQSITTLHISSNQISKLENLPQNLILLDIESNYIKNIHPLLPYIRHQKNALNIVSRSIALWISDGEINVDDNPLENPPMEIVKQGNEAILRHFEELEAEGGAPLREAKLLIIGSGGVGKTSLMTKLQDPKNVLPAEKDTTVGITVTQQPVPYQIDGESYTMNIWDFGGQDIYHPTHQFFLTKNSIYVLMEDGREQKTDFYYWLQVQELLAADSPLFIFQNVKHGSRCTIPIAELKGKFGNIKDYFELDLQEVTAGHSKYEQVVTELKAKLQTLPHIGEVWPRTRYAIRDTLTGMREQHYISLREYKTLCRKHNYTDEQGQKELLRQLHFLGVVLHFEDTPFLEDIVIINPQWATDAVYAILNHTEKHHEKNGRFTWQDLREVWQEEKYEGKYNEILTLMSKFELSFELPDEAHTYIAPLLLPDDKPDYMWDANANLQMEYRYDFMPKGILARLIVRLHRLIKDKLFWKRGVVFAHENTEAEVTEDYTGRHIFIRVKGREAKELIYWISTEIDAINASYHFSERIRARKFVPCNCRICEVAATPHFYDYKVLRRRIDELRRDTIECQISAEDVQVRGLLENIESTKPIPSSLKSGKGKKVFISYSKHDREIIEKELKPVLHPLERQGKVELFYDQDILPGDEWDAEIRAKLQAADIILLMVSTQFLATDYIWDVEIEKAIERHDKGEAKVIPIILSHCDWEGDATPFSKLNVLPSKGEPISALEDKDLAWVKVLEGIKDVMSARISDF